MATIHHSSESETGPRKRTGHSQAAVQFIQIQTPGKATSSSLSLIRSHVAKRQRTRKSKRSKTKVVNQDDDETPVKGKPAEAGALRAVAHSLKARPKASTTLIPRETAYSSSPKQLIGSSKKDAPHAIAGRFSVEEQFLFDFYFTYVISYGYEACYRTQDATLYHRLMREIWIPYVLAEPCLLSAIFHVACRNYLIVAKNGDNSNRFEIKMLEYRAKCLDNASKAIESKAGPSDTIIALALLLASESYLIGDVASFAAHGGAVAQMVRSRGGIQQLGMGGFLGRIVGSCIFKPSHNLVAGPIELIDFT